MEAKGNPGNNGLSYQIACFLRGIPMDVYVSIMLILIP
jgi:hypothetical protein